MPADDAQKLREAKVERQTAEAAEARPETALIPAGSIAGRALVTVIAIMTYLAALTAGVAIVIGDASRGWTQDISREITIQIRPAPGRDLAAEAQKAADLAKAAPGVGSVRVYTKQESEQLLQPWLGTGLDLGELPVPRLVVVRLAADSRPDLPALRKTLAEKIQGASLDDHGAWVTRLGAMANTLVLVAVVIFTLVLTAMALAVAFATRGAMAGTREIIAVLHFVGAEDRFIAGEFRRHFLRLGLRGGILGSAAALVTFYLASFASSLWIASAGGEQIEAMFGRFSLGLPGYLAIAAIAAGVAGLTGLMSRTIVLRQLRDLG
jgi:cell division transport system permease protein